jgi:arylsulfatase A
LIINFKEYKDVPEDCALVVSIDYKFQSMSRIKSITQISILPALVACSCAELSAIEKEQNRPNIIFVLLDDLGYGDLGCYSSTFNRTPAIDHMAQESIRFTDAYAASNVSTPSRAAFMTGKYPIRTGLTRVLFPNSKNGINQNENTIAEMLKQQGYTTGIIGKWHLGTQRQYLPLQQGFDYYLGIPYSNDMTPCVLMKNNEIIADEIFSKFEKAKK